MQIKIVNNVNKDENRRKHIYFKNGGDMLKPKDLTYKENDVVFVKKDENDNFKLINEYYIYNDIMQELIKKNENRRQNINKNLLINKFTNIFNLDEEYNESDEEKNILKKIDDRNKIIREILNNRYYWINFNGKINDKLVIGLGGQSVFETDMTLHHIYGVPYIPGQAIKGMFRNYIIQEYFGKYIEKYGSSCEKNIIKDKKFRLIFGGINDKDREVSGKVIFMDSFICGEYKIKRDVMTPHHKEYYSDNGDKLPLDSDEPTPLKFLVLNKDNVFQFNIAVDRRIAKYTDKDIFGEEKKEDLANGWCNNGEMCLKQFVMENFIDALNFYGIGAKTSVGYGYFDIDKDNIKKKREKQLKDLEEKKKKIEEEQRFKEATKDMSSLEIKFYKIKYIEDEKEKNEVIVKLFNSEIDNLEGEEQKKLAIYMKKYLTEEEKWKYKIGKNGKLDKNAKRIEKICNILCIEKPM